MATRAWICLLCLAMVSAVHQGARAETATSAPAAAVAGGQPVWIDSEPDSKLSLINVRVDVGTLRQVGDAIEARLAWTLRLGVLRDTRANHPDLDIPDGSQSIDRERIVCRPHGALFYRVENTLVSPAGELIHRRAFDPTEERRKEEEARWPISYGPDPRSLVCWAAARKCDDKPMSWPPPANNAPLEHSEHATRMRAEHDALFVPRCKL